MTAPAAERLLPAHVVTAAAAAAGVAAPVLAEAVRLALAGGPDVELPGWQDDAVCRGLPVDAFFPDKGHSRETRALLDACRQRCHVQSACLGYALAVGEREGVWGGTSAAGRRRLRQVLRHAGIMGVVGEDAYLAWVQEGADREPPARDSLVPTVTGPRPHQAAAVDAVTAALAAGGSCQVAMATASGKTHVGLWAAERLDARRVLILVPNLALVAQTAELWRSAAAGSIDLLAVCSDTGELDLEATTDPARVAEFLHAGGRRAVVLATYQSSAVLAAAGCRFDLTIADEAHHLAGEADKAFATVVRGEIPTDRTLYMTATPRKFRRRSGDVDLIDMDAPAFGPRVYELSLADAVAAGVVADYRVIVAAVDRATFDRVAKHPDLGDIDPHLLAGAIAVVRAMGDSDLRSCVSFHTRVERARSFASLIGAVAEVLPADVPAGPGWSGFIHGDTSMRIRRRLLARLVDAHTWGVLANAKTLGEGVDVPTLDSIAIVDPKTSEADVLQAVGRALRRPGGQSKVGTVLLPVLLSGDADPADPLAGIDERSIDIVAGVLRALRAHDGDLSSRLDKGRRSAGRADGVAQPLLAASLRRSAARALLRSRVELHLPGGATGELAGALSLRLIRESTAAWEEAFGRLEEWIRQHGHARVPQVGGKVPDETGTFSLGAWCTVQRTLRRRGLLAVDREARLDALPSWRWDPREEQWWEKFDALSDFVECHGRVPARPVGDWRGVNVGSFVNVVRQGYLKDGKDGGWLRKFPDRVAALESLPGWVWNQRDADWEEHFDQLRRWAAAVGHADPAFVDTIDGFRIGAWAIKQRAKMRRGELSDERCARLRALPGWRDEIRDEGYVVTWEENCRVVRDWMAANGGQPPPLSLVLPSGFRIGAWCNKQRARGRNGELAPERVEALSAIPGWDWTPRDSRWEACYEALLELARRGPTNDRLRIPQNLKLRGVNLSNWATTQRISYGQGVLPADRAERLEAIPGWSWGRRDISVVDNLEATG